MADIVVFEVAPEGLELLEVLGPVDWRSASLRCSMYCDVVSFLLSARTVGAAAPVSTSAALYGLRSVLAAARLVHTRQRHTQ